LVLQPKRLAFAERRYISTPKSEENL
jgi:hypothetical protein